MNDQSREVENSDMTVQEFYSGFDFSWMTEEERQTIYTATELYAKGKLRQRGSAVWVKASERLPDKGKEIIFRKEKAAPFKEVKQFYVNEILLSNHDTGVLYLEVYMSAKLCQIEWLDESLPAEDNQDELWDEIEEILNCRGTDDIMLYAADWNKTLNELKSQFIIQKKR